MDHQLFEHSMHDDKDLPEELQAAWRGLHSDMHAAGMAAPTPGFTDRFRFRLAEQRRQEERRQTWWFLGINLLMAGTLLLILSLRIFPALPAPADFVVSWAAGFAEVVTWFGVFIKVSSSLLRTLPALVPPSWWASILAAAVGLAFLWVATLRQYILPQGARS